MYHLDQLHSLFIYLFVYFHKSQSLSLSLPCASLTTTTKSQNIISCEFCNFGTYMLSHSVNLCIDFPICKQDILHSIHQPLAKQLQYSPMWRSARPTTCTVTRTSVLELTVHPPLNNTAVPIITSLGSRAIWPQRIFSTCSSRRTGPTQPRLFSGRPSHATLLAGEECALKFYYTCLIEGILLC